LGWNLRRRRSRAYYLEHIDRPLVSIVNLCIQGVGDKRYPNIPQVFSVRTEDLPAGLLHLGEPPLGFLGPTGSQYHRTRNASWPGCVACAVVLTSRRPQKA